MTKNKVTAVLGPTNTGKTHLAIETMLSFDSGMIGFPLRLLAREVYDKVIKKISLDKVALITGEEKIIPANPKGKAFEKVGSYNTLNGNPIIPLSKESIVSIARWVLPVFVGPRTAVILFLGISIFGVYFFLPTRYC